MQMVAEIRNGRAMDLNMIMTVKKSMACMHPLNAEMEAISNKVAEKEEDFIEGIVKGLKDFAEGHCTVFEDDEEMEAHLMRL